MSNTALGRAWIYPAPTPQVKLVALCMAEHANAETGDIFTSTARIVLYTGLDRKTVIAARQRMVDDHWLVDTGRRMGRTGQIKVYRFAERPPCVTLPPMGRLTADFEFKHPARGTGEASHQRDTEPSNMEPSSKSVDPLPPSGPGEGEDGDLDLFGQPMVDHVAAFEEAIVQRFTDGWIQLAERRPRVKGLVAMSDKRRLALLARVRESYAGLVIQEGERIVDTLLERVDGSPFLCGEVKDFSVGPDWVLGPDNFLKTMGRRNERDSANAGGPSYQAGQRVLAAMRDSRERSRAGRGAGEQ